jgi:hypothetical protein
LLGLLSVLVVPLLKIIEGEVNIVGDRMFVLAMWRLLMPLVKNSDTTP